jgi:hypothetical protein
MHPSVNREAAIHSCRGSLQVRVGTSNHMKDDENPSMTLNPKKPQHPIWIISILCHQHRQSTPVKWQQREQVTETRALYAPFDTHNEHCRMEKEYQQRKTKGDESMTVKQERRSEKLRKIRLFVSNVHCCLECHREYKGSRASPLIPLPIPRNIIPLHPLLSTFTYSSVSFTL